MSDVYDKATLSCGHTAAIPETDDGEDSPDIVKCWTPTCQGEDRTVVAISRKTST